MKMRKKKIDLRVKVPLTAAERAKFEKAAREDGRTLAHWFKRVGELALAGAGA